MTAPAHHTPRIPSLDGLRAASIAAVLLGHVAGTRGAPRWIWAFQSRHLDLAHLGVRVFFVISGFLITGLLVAERERAGGVRLSRFYLRRTLRIVPAYVTYLAVIALLTLAGVLAVPARDFWHALTYTVNYEVRPSWQVGHLWSLALEEQFYLLWPLAFVLAGARRAGWIAFGVACLVPVIRFVEWQRPGAIGGTFGTEADALALGCLLALWHEGLERRAWYRRALATRWLAPAMVLMSVLVSFGPPRLALLTQDAIASCAMAVFVARCVRFPTADVGILLNSRPFVYVGAVSYSLYLWQELFINRHGDRWPNAFPVNVCLAILCALASYYIVERPSLAFRPRAERWPGRRLPPEPARRC